MRRGVVRRNQFRRGEERRGERYGEGRGECNGKARRRGENWFTDPHRGHHEEGQGLGLR